MTVRPKSLILDLLGTMPRGSMPVRALTAAAGLFGIEVNSLRVALTRLRASGLIETDGRGRYRLGPQAVAVAAQVGSWRQLDRRCRTWTGGWNAVHTADVGRAGNPARGEQDRALRLLGFRPLASGLLVRPDNLAGGVTAAHERLVSLGLSPDALVFRLSDLDSATEARARRLWHAEDIITGHRRNRVAIERSERRLPELGDAAAMVESFTLGGSVLRDLALDPLLPPEIVPTEERDTLLAAMRRYDAAGRAIWARFLRGFSGPATSVAAEARVTQAPPPLAHALEEIRA